MYKSLFVLYLSLSLMIFKNVQLACCKAILCVFHNNVFLINIAVRYKIKKGVQYIGERGWDEVRKGLIWMGHNN